MVRLVIHDTAGDDLCALAERDKDGAARIAVFLQELAGDQDALDKLTVDHYEDTEINVCQIYSLQRRGLNLWRVKLAAIEDELQWSPYRIIYAFDTARRWIWILGIGKKGRGGFSYDQSDPIIRRVLETYDRLGLNRIPYAGD